MVCAETRVCEPTKYHDEHRLGRLTPDWSGPKGWSLMIWNASTPRFSMEEKSVLTKSESSSKDSAQCESYQFPEMRLVRVRRLTFPNNTQAHPVRRVLLRPPFDQPTADLPAYGATVSVRFTGGRGGRWGRSSCSRRSGCREHTSGSRMSARTAILKKTLCLRLFSSPRQTLDVSTAKLPEGMSWLDEMLVELENSPNV